jgi:hypothetical protein
MTSKPQTTKHLQKEKRKWINFTYAEKEVYRITNIFKKLKLGIAFKTNNSTLKQFSKLPQPTTSSKFHLSGIYQLTCSNCNMQYIRQTSRQFLTRYKEHLLSFRHNNYESKFAQHIHENKHSFGPIEDIMDILYITNKGTHMNTREKYHIYKTTKEGKQSNDKNTVGENIIFKTILHYNPT